MISIARHIASRISPAVLLISLLATGEGQAAPGDLDPSFGNGGIAAVDFGRGADSIMASVRDGSGGQILLVRVSDGTALLMRVNADGSRDMGFGTNGLLATGMPADTVQTSQSLVLDADGRIVVGGIFGSGTAYHFGVVRRLADGTLDPGFGSNGLSSEGPFNMSASPAMLRADSAHRIVIGAYAGVNTILLRLTPTGLGDLTFGPNGISTFAFNPPVNAAPLSLAFDGTNRLLLTSSSLNSGVTVRLTESGTLDGTFGNGGRLFNGAWGQVLSDTAGRILLARDEGNGSDSANRWVIARILDDGSPDLAFGTNGAWRSPFATYYSSAGKEVMQLDSFGRIVLGTTLNTCRIYRLIDSGNPDSSFGLNGLVSFPKFRLPDATDVCGAVTIGQDDSIVIAGTVGAYGTIFSNSTSDIGLAKVDSAGAVVTSFGNAGQAMFDLSNKGAGVNAVLVQPDGKVVVAGYTFESRGRSTDPVVVRLMPDGSPDASFGDAGKVFIAYDTAGSDYVFGLATDPSGNIIAGIGNYASVASCANCRAAVTRLTPSGAPDNSFSVGGMYTSDAGTRTRAVARDSRGYIYVAEEQLTTGPGGTLDPRRIRIERLFPNGNRDLSYGGTGAVFLPFDTPLFPKQNRASAIAIDALNRVIVAGAGITSGTASGPFVWRLDPEGAVDATFGSSGIAYVIEASGTRIKEVTGIAIDASHRVIVTGPSEGEFQVVRLTASGQADASFGSGGFVRINVTGAYEEGRSVIQDGAYLLLGGTSSAAEKYAFGALRLTANGTPDAAFGTGGWREYAVSPGTAIGVALARGADGRTVLAGDASDGFRLVRLMGSAAPMAEDFNLDGKPDLIWSNTTSGATYIWRMNGPTLLSDSLLATIDPMWKIQGVGDFNGDGHSDVVWRNTQNGNTYVWYLVDGVLQSDAFLFSLPPEWVIQGVADFNADGKPDFLMRNVNSGNAFAWFFNNNVPIGDQFLFNVDPVWKVEGVADLSADRQPDLLFRNTVSGLAFAWNTQYAAGSLSLTTSTPPIFGIDPVWEIAQVVDWNGDGKPDLLFRNRDSGVVFVWYMDGTTLTTSDFITQIDPSWEIVPRR